MEEKECSEEVNFGKAVEHQETEKRLQPSLQPNSRCNGQTDVTKDTKLQARDTLDSSGGHIKTHFSPPNEYNALLATKPYSPKQLASTSASLSERAGKPANSELVTKRV